MGGELRCGYCGGEVKEGPVYHVRCCVEALTRRDVLKRLEEVRVAAVETGDGANASRLSRIMELLERV